jgi:hypothetical protein
MKFSFLNYKTRTQLKRNKSSRESLPYKQAMTIGVIFTVEDKAKHDEVKEFVKRLEHDGKQVKVLCYLPKNKDNYEFMFDFFTEKELSFWGTITSNTASQFADTKFDFLFYADTTPNPMIMNLVARSKSKCRVGKYWEDKQAYFEMMLESKEGLKGLLETMYRYASVLR